MIAVLEKTHRNFDQSLASEPPENIDALAPLGYTAFRWATQIDPLWNLYFLALAIMIADVIEAKRWPIAHESVYSYRFAPDPTSGHLFANSTWRDYKRSEVS